MDDFHLCPVSDYYERILLPLTYSLVFLLGLGLNGALLWSVCCGGTRSCWTGTVIYLVNLSVADLLYVLSLPPLIISSAMANAWPFGDAFCKAVRFFFLANLHCSMMFLTCVSVYRFLGVCYPIAALRLRTRKRALFASGSVWVLVTAEILPTLVFAHTGSINNVTVCFEMTGPGQFKMYFSYGIFLTIVGFLLPFLVILTCYCSVVKTLCCMSSGSNTHVRFGRMRNKFLRTLLVVCLMFALCFVPYHVAQAVYLFVRVYMVGDCRVLNVAIISFKVWKPLVSFNCCVNPLVYFWGCDRYRKNIQAWLWRRRRNTRVQPAVCVVDVGSTKRSRG
ncbi:P2Y purinoceptor 3-like [Diretmus argenteus]